MSKRIPVRGQLLLALIAITLTGCISAATRLRRELLIFMEGFPEPPESLLLSEAEDATGGSDDRCDGYVISRLYGSDQSLEDIVAQVADLVFEEYETAAYSGVNAETRLGLSLGDGYRLGLSGVELSPELIRDPFFLHNDIEIHQPYATIFQINVVHIDSSAVAHCWGD
jgi:hypothetical protein